MSIAMRLNIFNKLLIKIKTEHKKTTKSKRYKLPLAVLHPLAVYNNNSRVSIFAMITKDLQL